MALLVLMLAGCGSVPVPPEPVAPPQASRENFQVNLEGGFTLDYQIERKISALNGKSCYFFVTGTLSSQSSRTLSNKSVLDFIATRHGKQAYRDIANPVSNIAPGGRAMFGLLASPTYMEGCPIFETFSVSLRKVFLD